MLDPLAQLRDIHLPAKWSIWPFAPGWYCLLILVCVAIGYGIYLSGQWLRRRRAKKTALRYLEKLQTRFSDTQQARKVIAELSTLLKRIALASFERSLVAGLHGRAWLRFLDKYGHTEQFTQGHGQLLITAPYMRQLPEDSECLFPLIKRWIEKNG